jgi:hypothetical protein
MSNVAKWAAGRAGGSRRRVGTHDHQVLAFWLDDSPGLRYNRLWYVRQLQRLVRKVIAVYGTTGRRGSQVARAQFD